MLRFAVVKGAQQSSYQSDYVHGSAWDSDRNDKMALSSSRAISSRQLYTKMTKASHFILGSDSIKCVWCGVALHVCI